MAKSKYHRMSIAEKEERNRLYAPPVRCPRCSIAVQPADLVAHRLERCAGPTVPLRCPECEAVVPVEEMADHIAKKCKGRPDPHPKSRWMTVRQAQGFGLKRRALYKLADKGTIRTKGERGLRRFLLRDVARCVARVKAKEKAREQRENSKETDNELTTEPKASQIRKMEKPKDLKTRISTFIEANGSVAAAARKLGVPEGAFRRAANGESVREGTQVLIENQLDKAKA